MEPRITTISHRPNGFALVVVLIITAVGLLFGAGALLLFRYQCQLRIDREHELQKLYAVRSALNFIRTSTPSSLGGNTVKFSYYTDSGRNLGVIVKPVDPIFPVMTNETHLVMESSDSTRNFQPRGGEQVSYFPEYEYGSEGMTNMSVSGSYVRDEGTLYGLLFKDAEETNKFAKCWVNIGMSGTGGWLQEEYGRRYSFHPSSFAGQDSTTGDVVRLCIIRNVTNESERARGVGRVHGWPLSQEGERALVFQVQPIKENNDVLAHKAICEFVYTNGEVRTTCLYNWKDGFSQCPMGVQIAGDRISMFYVNLAGMNEDYGDPIWFGFDFQPKPPSYVQMTPATYNYFRDGIMTNRYGKVKAPELRAVIEVQTAASARSSSPEDFLTKFKVMPAYQYDVLVEYPPCKTNQATVAQVIGSYDEYGIAHTVLTYDTHGTENKGFRKDEREAERKRNGR